MRQFPCHPKIFAGSVFTGALPGFYAEPSFAENFPNFVLEHGDFTCRIGSDTSVVYVSVLLYGLKDGRLEIGRTVLDECLDSCNFFISSVIAGGTVPKGDCSVTEEVPGEVGRWWAGEEVARYTDIPEEGVLVAGANRSEELLDVVHCKGGLASGAH